MGRQFRFQGTDMRALMLVGVALGLSACVIVVPTFPALGPIEPDPATVTNPPCAAPADQSERQTQVLAQLNAERAKTGLAALSFDPRLSAAAQRLACDNAARGIISHTGSDGSSLASRLRREGFALQRAAENTALIRTDGPGPVALWMDSRDHRNNILLDSVDRAGLGRASANAGREAWVLVLGRGR
jgi:uncharacterized protein YkwD